MVRIVEFLFYFINEQRAALYTSLRIDFLLTVLIEMDTLYEHYERDERH